MILGTDLHPWAVGQHLRLCAPGPHLGWYASIIRLTRTRAYIGRHEGQKCWVDRTTGEVQALYLLPRRDYVTRAGGVEIPRRPG